MYLENVTRCRRWRKNEQPHTIEDVTQMLVASGASLGNLKEPTATSIASSVIAFMAVCVAERCVARQAIADDDGEPSPTRGWGTFNRHRY